MTLRKATLDRRAEILFSAIQYDVLQEMATSLGQSVGALVRQAVDQVYVKPRLTEKQQAARSLVAANLDVGDWSEIKQWIVKEAAERYETA